MYANGGEHIKPQQAEKSLQSKTREIAERMRLQGKRNHALRDQESKDKFIMTSGHHTTTNESHQLTLQQRQ